VNEKPNENQVLTTEDKDKKVEDYLRSLCREIIRKNIAQYEKSLKLKTAGN
jgi:hypothetical protein